MVSKVFVALLIAFVAMSFVAQDAVVSAQPHLLQCRNADDQICQHQLGHGWHCARGCHSHGGSCDTWICKKD